MNARTVLAGKGSLRRANNGAPLPPARRSGQTTLRRAAPAGTLPGGSPKRNGRLPLIAECNRPEISNLCQQPVKGIDRSLHIRTEDRCCYETRIRCIRGFGDDLSDESGDCGASAASCRIVPDVPTDEKPVKAVTAMFLRSSKLLKRWSGRRESNSQPTAWKAVTLPLSYSRLRATYTL